MWTSLFQDHRSSQNPCRHLTTVADLAGTLVISLTIFLCRWKSRCLQKWWMAGLQIRIARHSNSIAHTMTPPFWSYFSQWLELGKCRGSTFVEHFLTVFWEQKTHGQWVTLEWLHLGTYVLVLTNPCNFLFSCIFSYLLWCNKPTQELMS
jgi:hypothetical protein